MRGRRWVLAVLCVATVATSAPVASSTLDPHNLGNPRSDWRPVCGIDGKPLEVDFPFCISNYIDARFVGDPSNSFFHMGLELRIAVYDEEGGAVTYGTGSSEYNDFDGVSFATKGSGAPDDPFVNRQVYTAADPAQLRITQYTTYVNGSTGFDTRYVVQNISGGPIRFRVWVIGDTITPDCGYGSLQTNPRVLGTWTMEQGAPVDDYECSYPERYRGYGGYTIEQPNSPWDRYEQGHWNDVFGHLDPHGPGLTNTIHEEITTASHAVQWDDHSLSGQPLASGGTAAFDLRWRFANMLTVTPFRQETLKNRVTLKVSTRNAHNGPLTGKRVSYYIRPSASSPPDRYGSVVTDERGIAHITVERPGWGTDYLTYFFDKDVDRRLDEDELFRSHSEIFWAEEWHWDYPYRSRVSINYDSGKFFGWVTSKTGDPDHECRSLRMVTVKQRREGRDLTIGTAGTRPKGYWDLVAPREEGSYYAVVPSRWGKEREYDVWYECGPARADL